MIPVSPQWVCLLLGDLSSLDQTAWSSGIELRRYISHLPLVPGVMLGLVFISGSLLSARMAVPVPTGGHASSHDVFGKGIQTSVWAARQAGKITAPAVCLDLSLELLNCGRPANTSGIEGKLLLSVSVYCLHALSPNLLHFQLPIDISPPPLCVSGR